MSHPTRRPALVAVHLRLAAAVVLLLAAATTLPPAAHASDAADAVRQTLEQARAAGSRGVTLQVQGSSVSLLVTAIEGAYVIGRSAQHERIVVRIDRIDAVAF